MGYEIKFGDEADKALDTTEQEREAEQLRKNASKILFSLKSGTKVNVRVPSDRPRAVVPVHSVYKSFNSNVCTKEDCLYCKASNKYKELADEAFKAGDTETSKKLNEHHRLLSARNRVLTGFVNLETGQPIVIDFSEAQYKVIKPVVDKYLKRIDKLAFELSKDGTGTATKVYFSVVLSNEDDLTADELANFEATLETTIDKEIFANCLIVHNGDEQRTNLSNYGFDLKLLDEVSDSGEVEATEIIEDEDYQF